MRFNGAEKRSIKTPGSEYVKTTLEGHTPRYEKQGRRTPVSGQGKSKEEKKGRTARGPRSF